MKPIHKLKKAIQEYEEETGSMINSIEIKDRTVLDSKENRQSIDFNLNIDMESL